MYNTVPNAKALGNCLIKTRFNRKVGRTRREKKYF